MKLINDYTIPSEDIQFIGVVAHCLVSGQNNVDAIVFQLYFGIVTTSCIMKYTFVFILTEQINPDATGAKKILKGQCHENFDPPVFS